MRVRVRVREMREAKGWTQAELARRAGVHRVTITRIESGAAAGIEFKTLGRLARALGVAPGYLVTRD